jgi:GxxExxY protein
MVELIYKEEVYAIVGAAMQVYNELGPGFLEAVYQEALEIEMGLQGILFESQKELVVFYKGRCLRKTYVADFLAYGKIIVEIKAHDRLTPVDEAQLLHYLKATKTEVGVLVNFGSKNNLEWKRLVKSRLSPKSTTLSENS